MPCWAGAAATGSVLTAIAPAALPAMTFKKPLRESSLLLIKLIAAFL
jgi:hypothetical protein